MDNTILISTPPHVKTRRTTKKIMLDVIIALIPCAIMGIVYFGVDAFCVEITAILGAVEGEFVYFFIYKGGFKKKCANARQVCADWWQQFDYTSIVTGLILALIVPSHTPWYATLIGALFSIIIVKMVFGGTGKNIVNPAATGRVFMLISFSVIASGFAATTIGAIGNGATLTTGATNLTEMLENGGTESMSLVDLLLGTGVSGCIGETCKVAIIVGGVYLCIRKVIKWWQPLLFIGTAWLFTLFLNGCDPTVATQYTLSGGLLFGAVFMATDYCTSPKNLYGQLVYYFCLGLLTAVLRQATHIEVVSFVIMLCNILTPLIDRYIMRRPFGYIKAKKTFKKMKKGKEV
ncbi:MAG: RnfABCDGE type electron transport complex subunit D [Clostridia bacterium]|nr:RnfABCDGE type electron transport complex subunit D [Clostridia bacterium]